MPALCEICNTRPAVARVTVVQNGERKTLSICDYDYRQLMRHQSMVNPLDSLLGGGGLSRFFGGLGGADEDDEAGFAAEVPRESVDATDAFSEQTLELLQRAAEKAHELRRTELDTEHVLYVLADADVCAALLKELKLSPQDIKGYIDQHAQTGTANPDAPIEKMTISPRMKKVFQYAFQASRDLRSFLCRPGASADWACVGTGQYRGHIAKEVWCNAGSAAAESGEGSRQRRRGRPRRYGERHAYTRQVRT